MAAVWRGLLEDAVYFRQTEDGKLRKYPRWPRASAWGSPRAALQCLSPPPYGITRGTPMLLSNQETAPACPLTSPGILPLGPGPEASAFWYRPRWSWSAR